jgi:anti-sigma B factor antagonist
VSFPQATSPPRPIELPAPSLVVRLDPADGILHVSGVLDQRTASAFHTAVTALLADPRRDWVIDVVALDACDVTGLRALGIAYRRALVRGRGLVVTGAPPWLCRALHRVRLDGHLLDGTPAAG